ncbi:MAG TPA: GNAT family N-acetyltransferase, partial [Rhodopila sp.]
MRGICCADLTIGTFPTADVLPPDAMALLDTSTSIFSSLSWWNAVLAHAMPAGATAVFVTVRSGGRTVAVVPMLRNRGQLSSLTTPYTCWYAPLIAAGLDQPERIAAMAAFAGFGRSMATIRLDALPAAWDGLADLEAGSRRAGFVPLPFDHFGNWYEDVAGLDWSRYLLRRPGALRETIRRRMRRADNLDGTRFDLFTGPEQLDRGAKAFEFVYGRSWKDTEPFPAFNVALMRAMADLGLLRL